jgi:hypothetical protein
MFQNARQCILYCNNNTNRSFFTRNIVSANPKHTNKPLPAEFNESLLKRVNEELDCEKPNMNWTQDGVQANIKRTLIQ